MQTQHDVVAAGGGDGRIRLWDLRSNEGGTFSGTATKTIRLDGSIFSVAWITCLQWDENKVVTGHADKSIKITDIISGTLAIVPSTT